MPSRRAFSAPSMPATSATKTRSSPSAYSRCEDEYRRWRAEADADETQRVDRVSAFVESQAVEGVYEVIDVVDD